MPHTNPRLASIFFVPFALSLFLSLSLSLSSSLARSHARFGFSPVLRRQRRLRLRSLCVAAANRSTDRARRKRRRKRRKRRSFRNRQPVERKGSWTALHATTKFTLSELILESGLAEVDGNEVRETSIF
jgi:hypothetical protein